MEILTRRAILVFYDIGSVKNVDSINLPAYQSAASTGIGARFAFIPQLNGNFFIAKPLTTPVSTLVAEHENGNRISGFFQIVASFA